ncbi:hypothetical protein D6855_13720 [Butyrivibrio sp. CB08]|uniref:hypothetical protein n=1 Tax=Butyrivibrio sp. CB08 TaxID=2364879 RepID=UPI000EA8EB22|nr:hypothetical protein [Butyrivibrio sp. CB08]RKM57597.1 hypothetical protein D6855_13720 [Butyrivibrio sp. CB08]
MKRRFFKHIVVPALALVMALSTNQSVLALEPEVKEPIAIEGTTLEKPVVEEPKTEEPKDEQPIVGEPLEVEPVEEERELLPLFKALLKTEPEEAVSDEENPTRVSSPSIAITVIQLVNDDNPDGNKAVIDAAISGIDDYEGYAVWFYSGSGSANKNRLTESSFSKTYSISGGKTYEFHAELIKDGELVADSNHVEISVVKQQLDKSDISTTASVDDGATGTVSVNVSDDSKLVYYRTGSNDKTTVDGNTISGLAPGEYYVYLPAYSDGNTYYIKSSAQRAVVAGGGVAPVIEYTVRTSGDDNVKFSKTEQTVKEGGNASLNITAKNNETHYIDTDSIKVEPSENYESKSFYKATGELTITGIKGDITVSASSIEKPVLSELKVKSVTFNPEGKYSEENPYIQTTIELEALDKDGNPVPEKKIYFRDDKSGVSYTSTRTTDEKGIVTFKNSYGISAENGDITADYSPLFGDTQDFTGISASTDIHLILQQKKNLVLNTDQLVGSKPGKTDGKVINVPDDYEIWTGEVIEEAIVLGTGDWARPTDGRFTDLAPGAHLLRIGEKRDSSTNTFWFASDHEVFYIPRGMYDVSIDVDNSKNITFNGDTAQSAEPGQTVYFYLSPEEGSKISGFVTDHPSYFDSIGYDAESGYVFVKNVHGSIVITINTTSTEQKDDDKKTDDSSNDDSSNDQSSGESSQDTYQPSAGVQPAPAVLGAQRDLPTDSPAVLGARKSGTSDTSVLGSIITIIVAVAIAFSMIFVKRKKKEEQ